MDRTDVGLDLVGTLRDGAAAAIQCKLYSPDRRILKQDIDSFISASAKDEIVERHITRTSSLVERPGSTAQHLLADFLNELRDDLNKSDSVRDANR